MKIRPEKKMRSSRNIIAALAFTIAAPAIAEPGPVTAGQEVDSVEDLRFQSYRTKLLLRCNGQRIGESRQNVARGHSVGSELGDVSQTSGSCRAHGKLRLYQRVTSFPSAPSDMALLQLELFSDEGQSSRRMIAPTFGIRLGEEQIYSVKSEWGDISIEATVNGADRTPDPEAVGPRGVAYPGL